MLLLTQSRALASSIWGRRFASHTSDKVENVSVVVKQARDARLQNRANQIAQQSEKVSQMDSLPFLFLEQYCTRSAPAPFILSKPGIPYWFGYLKSKAMGRYAWINIRKAISKREEKYRPTEEHVVDMENMGVNLIRAIAWCDKKMIISLTSLQLAHSLIKNMDVNTKPLNGEFVQFTEPSKVEEIVFLPVSGDDSWAQLILRINTKWRFVRPVQQHKAKNNTTKQSPTTLNNTIKSLDLLNPYIEECRTDYLIFENHITDPNGKWRIISCAKTTKSKPLSTSTHL